MARPALNTATLLHCAQAPSGENTPTQTLSHPLAHSFLQEIAVPFGDHNPKGSTTRVLRIIANASLEEAEVMRCLVRAYTIARDTQTLRHIDPITGQANRMPLFCTLFERFAHTCKHQDTRHWSWQQVEHDLAADPHLMGWWRAHHFLGGTPADPGPKGSQERSGTLPLTTEPSQALRAARLFAPVSWPVHQPDPYEVYITTLMTEYRVLREAE